MSAQYEPCEHRHDATNPDAFYTSPCPICEAEERKGRRMQRVVAAAIAVSAVVSALIVWGAA